MTQIINALRQGKGDLALKLIQLAQPYDLNQLDEYGQGALHIAIQKNLLSVAKALIEKGANINATASDLSYTDMTPLHYAALTGNEEAVKLLLAWGANTRLENGHFHTPSTLAYQHGFIDISHLIKRHTKPLATYAPPPLPAIFDLKTASPLYAKLTAAMAKKTEETSPVQTWLCSDETNKNNVIDFIAYKKKKRLKY